MSDASEFADDLNGWLKARNFSPLRVDALSNTHPHAMLMTAMLRVLEVLAGIAFVCSATLAACIISLWMRREVRQVGIMKTLGARSWQLARQYLALVAPLVLFTVALAFPIGIALGRWVVKYHQWLLNIDVADWNVPRALFAEGAPLRRGRAVAGDGGPDSSGGAHHSAEGDPGPGYRRAARTHRFDLAPYQNAGQSPVELRLAE